MTEEPSYSATYSADREGSRRIVEATGGFEPPMESEVAALERRYQRLEGARLLAAAEVGLAVERLLNAWGEPASCEVAYVEWSDAERWFVRADKPNRRHYGRIDRKQGTGPTLVAAIDAALEGNP